MSDPNNQDTPVAWTGSGSLLALQDNREGFIWRSKADAHPIPLYSSDHLDRMRERAERAEALLAEAKAIIERQSAALSPLRDAVFNDNGDMTIRNPSVTADQCVSAYFIDKDARTLLTKLQDTSHE